MANSITGAFSSFNTIMQRELALLQVKMLEQSRNAPAVAPAPAPASGPGLSINIDVIIDKKIAELEERIMAKIAPMCQVRTFTCVLSDAIEAIDTKVKEIEQQIAEPEVKVEEPEVNVVEPEVKVEEPEVKVVEPEVKVAEPEVKVVEPEVKVAEPEDEAEEEEAEEEEAEEDEAEEEEAEELTEFRYKGKTYFMDSECNVYGLDANGDLIDDPIGSYDETTRKITFNN